MITIPCYNQLILPNVVFHFQDDFLEEIIHTRVEKGDEVLFLMMKEDKTRAEMTKDDFYPVAVCAVVEGFDKDENIIIRTRERVLVTEIKVLKKDIKVQFEELAEIDDMTERQKEEKYQEVKSTVYHFILQYNWGLPLSHVISQWDTIEKMATGFTHELNLSSEEKYAILAEDTISVRQDLLEKAIVNMVLTTQLYDEAGRVLEEKQEKLYREEVLRKQIDVFRDELEKMHPENASDIRKFENRLKNSEMNEEARKEAEKVLSRMRQEGENSHEYGLLYDYLEFVTSLSWKKEAYEPIDLEKAKSILDEDHFAMKKVKRRVLQQLAVMALRQKQSGSILLFVGPPGTGKTSIGEGIAKALGRKYVRISLGGIRDEAEIRGHRRTYIGAMPGRIMEGIKRSGVSNPVVVLDEIDKLSHSGEGDPANALLEVLDPEQNHTFTDHYMNVPYDLSDVLFICTANSVDTISEPLLNRMEMVEFQGYTENEKVEIAKRHLIPKSLKENGIKKTGLRISDTVLHKIIAEYTMESGVRGLKKRMDTLCREAAIRMIEGEGKAVTVKAAYLPDMLDMQPIRHDKATRKKKPGVVTGLAWTMAGGDILFVEAVMTPGKGEVQITGQLGDVMKESVQVALTLAKSMFPQQKERFEKSDIHIHVPEGAVPKDGPSAGITMTTAISSLILGKSVSAEYAMTGEVSLQGDILPIGGLPEKLMAAVRAGVKKVFIPKENEMDLKDVADEIKAKLTILPVEEVSQVFKEVGLKD
ncbi:MAG: endopeptidase La [Lachnospiraceae bacterium]